MHIVPLVDGPAEEHVVGGGEPPAERPADRPCDGEPLAEGPVAEPASGDERPADEPCDGELFAERRVADEDCSGDPHVERPAASGAQAAILESTASSATTASNGQKTVTLDRWLQHVPVGGQPALVGGLSSPQPHLASKMFQPKIEEELKQFLCEHGYGGEKPVVIRQGSIPKWGAVVFEDGACKLQAIQRPAFG